jgi:hypothetical protein
VSYRFEKEKSDPRISNVMLCYSYQLTIPFLMSMTPIVLGNVVREEVDDWKAIADHFGYCTEWNVDGIECSCRSPDICPFDAGTIIFDKVK